MTGSTTVQQQGRCPHDVLSGTWIDPYTGKRLELSDLKEPRQAQAVQIANDLAALVASDGPTNASKGSDDPAAWRPKQPYRARTRCGG